MTYRGHTATPRPDRLGDRGVREEEGSRLEAAGSYDS